MTPKDSTLSLLLPWRAFVIASVSCLALGVSLAALAQGSSLTAEKVVSFTTSKTLPLSAKVGQVSVQSVEFTDRGRGSGSLGGVLRSAAVSEMSTTIRAHFVAENLSSDDWEVTFTLEFLDKSGKLIDRATRKQKWDNEAKPFDFDHPILQYVVPAIAQVRIKLEGRLD
jgi:hypothetical protein